MNLSSRCLAAPILAFVTLTGVPAAQAQVPGPPKPAIATAAPAERKAIPLYPDSASGSAPSEDWALLYGTSLVVRNVTRPTLTPFFPAPGTANGAAVIILPGGAFMRLGIDWEGWRVAKAFAAKGVTAFVLKYRLLPTPHDELEAASFMNDLMFEDIKETNGAGLFRQSFAADDAKAALKLVSEHSRDWNLDRGRIGIIGFSAGAMTARRVALALDTPVRPAFLGYFYGPQQSEPVPATAPPLFDAIAFDDPLFASSGFAIAEAWRAAGRPVELHGYQQGGHGFGLGRPGTTTTLVFEEFMAWLDMQGLLKPLPALKKPTD